MGRWHHEDDESGPFRKTSWNRRLFPDQSWLHEAFLYAMLYSQLDSFYPQHAGERNNEKTKELLPALEVKKKNGGYGLYRII